MTESKVSDVGPNEIDEIFADGGEAKDSLSIEALILLIHTERLAYLRQKSHTELSELKERQNQVATLHKLLQKINQGTSSKGELDCSSNKEIQDLIKEAKKLGVECKEGQHKFSKEERDRLVENIRLTADDLNVKNEMQLQVVNRLTNERFECYQMARSILKPLHEAKMRVLQGFKQS